MNTAVSRRRGKLSGPAAWSLVALLLGAIVLAGLFLFEGARPSARPEAASGRSPASEDRELLSPPDLLAAGEVPPAEPLPVAPSGRQPAGARRHTIEGVVLDTETGLPVPLYEIYLAPGAAGDPRSLPDTRPPHHVRDLEGRFRLTTPSRGTHRLLIRSQTHEDLARNVTVPSEAPLELYLERGTWLSGALRNLKGEPQADVTVWLHSRDEGPGARAEARTQSDDEGRYAFFKLRAGTYRLTAGPLTAPLAVRDDLVVLDRQHVKVDLVLPRQTEVVVHVEGADGQPIVEARVTLLTEEGSLVRTGITSGEGLVRIPHVQSGPHVLRIRAAGFADLEEELLVGAMHPRTELHRTLTR